ncbi:MAG: hypothetical protein KAS17_05985, partial [Victivallaceae bacterium]|nr:hypothetical protein [Victivallaceae bacterium]
KSGTGSIYIGAVPKESTILLESIPSTLLKLSPAGTKSGTINVKIIDNPKKETPAAANIKN